MAEDPAGGESDVESVYGDDEDALGWYAKAAAGDDDDDASEGDQETMDVAQEDATADDPYLAATDDPYGALNDPYGGGGDESSVPVATEKEVAPATTAAAPVVASASSSTTHADIVGPEGAKISDRLAARRAARRAAADADADANAPWRQPPKKVQKTQAQAQIFVPTPAVTAPTPVTPAPASMAPAPMVTPQSPPAVLGPISTTPTPVPPMPSLTPMMPQDPPEKPALVSQSPPPAPPMPEVLKDIDVNMTSTSEQMESTVLEASTLDVEAVLGDDVIAIEDMSWDEKVVVVKQGQLYIEMQRRSPPMPDATLMTFCDWLDAQMPLVVSNFPYVRKSGAYVDLSDNLIGPDGLDKLFRVLRDHRVPCVVIKAFRNLLDDSIVDTLVEYLYTQPEAFPMHGIHMSHNNITDKGAFRLIQAAAQCGHYPRLTSRLPLWLRLECNSVLNPQKVVTDCNMEKFNVCLMGNGTCSRPDCNHYSGVHVQLPYFFHQQTPGNSENKSFPFVGKAPPICPPVQSPPNSYIDESVQAAAPSPELEEDGSDLLSIYRAEVPANLVDGPEPDWRRKERLATTMQAAMMVPAPKRQDFTPAPKRAAPKLVAQSKAIPSRPQPPPEQRSFSPYLEDNAGYVPLLSDDWQASSPYLDSSVIADGFDPSPVASNGNFGDGDLAAGGPSGGKKGQTWKSNDKGGSWKGNSKGWKGGGKKDKFGGKGWKSEAWKGNGDSWSFADNGGGYQDRGKGGWKGAEDGGKGKGKGKKGKYWVGQALTMKVKKDMQLSEGDSQLGFHWQYLGDGIAPRITSVDFGSKVAQVIEAGCSLLRMNGLDATMLTEKQITDLLKGRPLALRFGDQ